MTLGEPGSSLRFEECAVKCGTGSDSGIYLLLIHLAEAANTRVGVLGEHLFPAGYYVYAGSAQRGLRARLRRHAAVTKRRRWHVDYLTAMGKVLRTLAFSGGKEVECILSLAVGRLPGARLHIRGFGASDCRCEGHLHYFAAKPALPGLLDRLMRLAIIPRGGAEWQESASRTIRLRGGTGSSTRRSRVRRGS